MLTGNTRFRCMVTVTRNLCLVLQVEEEIDHSFMSGGHVMTRDEKRWRDARVEDLTELKMIQISLGGQNVV